MINRRNMLQLAGGAILAAIGSWRDIASHSKPLEVEVLDDNFYQDLFTPGEYEVAVCGVIGVVGVGLPISEEDRRKIMELMIYREPLTPKSAAAREGLQQRMRLLLARLEA